MVERLKFRSCRIFGLYRKLGRHGEDQRRHAVFAYRIEACDNTVVPFVANGTGKIDLQSGAVALDLAPGDMAAGLVATRTAIIANVNVVSSTAALNPSGHGIGYATAQRPVWSRERRHVPWDERG